MYNVIQIFFILFAINTLVCTLIWHILAPEELDPIFHRTFSQKTIKKAQLGTLGTGRDRKPRVPKLPEKEEGKQWPVVKFKQVLKASKHITKSMTLPVILGHDEGGKIHAVDLAKGDHLLICGASGQGKSNELNNIVQGLLRLAPTAILKLGDPKMVEFAEYEKKKNVEYHADLPKIMIMLKQQVVQMNKRYKLLKENGCKSFSDFNRKFPKNKLPMIVIIVDEFAMVADEDKEFSGVVSNLARVGRASGICLILATQRPDKDAVTGQIKANMNRVICYRVADTINSRIVLGRPGAENLAQRGRCIYKSGVEFLEIQSPLN